MLPKPKSEETTKTQIVKEFFGRFDIEHEDRIDLMVAEKHQKDDDEKDYYLWAEAKKGNSADIYESLTQLIITANKSERMHPNYFGAFDAEKIVFLDNYDIEWVFNDNDIDKNVTPSNHKSPEFQKIHASIKDTLERSGCIYRFDEDKDELKTFIKDNFKLYNEKTKKQIINKNNFQKVFYKWLDKVKPAINFEWEDYKADIIEADFFIADLLSKDNETIRENLRILLQKDTYKVKENVLKHGKNTTMFQEFEVIDKKAHESFWNKYERPPEEVVQNFIIDHRCVLLPQDYRKRTGAFFTPEIWVKKAQDYLAQTLGKNWQDEHYIWDCAAGSGNLLVGLTNKYNVFASTLDRADYYGMIDRIQKNELNLLENNVFQFDFLNDDFFNKFDDKGKLIEESKLPKELQEILNDENKRKRLVIFINPPYGEASDNDTINSETNKHKAGISNTVVRANYLKLLGRGANELFIQFFIRIQQEIQGCILASFSTLKYINSSNFIKFRQNFKAKFLKGFCVPSITFKNNKKNKESFPIGFLIWDLNSRKDLKEVQLDVFESDGEFKGKKGFYARDKFILDWLSNYYDQQGNKTPNKRLAYLVRGASDFQNNRIVFMDNNPSQSVIKHSQTNDITAKNLIPNCIFATVRKIIEKTWLNNRDQFLYPNDKWQDDTEFQNDCLAFALFHEQNNITSKDGINHFIPFTPTEMDAKASFSSTFMSNFIKGKNTTKDESGLFEANDNFIPTKPLEFSIEAKAVFNAGRELWCYYHAQDFKYPQKPYNANASLYDIREYFQGCNDKPNANGKFIMNPPNKAKDEHYKTLYHALQDSLKALAEKIKPKIYEYGFLIK